MFPLFPLLEVAKVAGGHAYVSKDHRRLYCLKELQRRSRYNVKLVKTRVRVIADVYDIGAFQMLCDKYNPVDGGDHIKIRHR